MKLSIMVAVIGALIVMMGLIGMLMPTVLMALLDRWQGVKRLWLAVVVRLVMGVMLLTAAAETRFPTVVTAIGVIAVVAACAIPLMGYERLDRLVSWWIRRPPLVISAWSVLAVLFGGFLVYAAL